MKPDDISAGAWERALAVVFEIGESEEHDAEPIARAIDDAVRAEREACASMLEAMAKTYLPGGPMDAKGGLVMGAAAIRNRKQEG